MKGTFEPRCEENEAVGQDIQEEIIPGREGKKCTVPQEEVSWVSREEWT